MHLCSFVFFFFNDTATTEIYTLSLHDALPISASATSRPSTTWCCTIPTRESRCAACWTTSGPPAASQRSSTPTRPPSTEIGRAHVELQSRQYLVCRLLLEKKKIRINTSDCLLV